MTFKRVKDARPLCALKSRSFFEQSHAGSVLSVFRSTTVLVVPPCHMMFQGRRVPAHPPHIYRNVRETPPSIAAETF